MASADLQKLRAEIDAIDEQLQDLILRRAAVVDDVARAKAADGGDAQALALRPGREAVVMRRLLARHRGKFPRQALFRMWREMIGALTRVQAPFSVAVYMPPDRPGYWDMARDHYGTRVPVRPHESTAQALAELDADANVIAILPLPVEGAADRWWLKLASQEKNTPNVVARLPFIDMGNSRTQGLDALVLARLLPEPSGDEAEGADRALLVIQSDQDLSRGRISDCLVQAGLKAPTSIIRDAGAGSDKSGAAYLVEVPGFVFDGDARLGKLQEALPGARLTPIGCYAVPVARDGAV